MSNIKEAHQEAQHAIPASMDRPPKFIPPPEPGCCVYGLMVLLIPFFLITCGVLVAFWK